MPQLTAAVDEKIVGVPVNGDGEAGPVVGVVGVSAGGATVS